MKKLGFICLLVLLICCRSSTDVLRPEKVFAGAKGEKEEVKPGEVLSYESVKETITFLTSDDLNGRKSGTPGIEKAASFIEAIFKKNNLKPYFSTYRDTLSNFKGTAYNIVGMIEGSDSKLKEEFVIVGAHYDHIGYAPNVNGDSIANGANDNASGSTAVIELAKYFSKKRINKRSLMFVLFSAEELGLLGSKHLASKLKEKDMNLYGMVNFEMIGVALNGKDYVAYITGYAKSNMASKLNEYTGKNTIGYLEKAKEYQLFMRSDNYPFYKEFKVPAQTVSTFDFTNFDYYHHADDEVSEMDIPHMVYVIKEMIPAIEKMVNTPEKEISLESN